MSNLQEQFEYISNSALAAIDNPISYLTPLQLAYVDDIIEERIKTELNNSLWCNVECINVKAAAQRLGLKESTIREWITLGKLNASKVANVYLIPLANIQRMLHDNACKPVVHLDKRKKINKLPITN